MLTKYLATFGSAALLSGSVMAAIPADKEMIFGSFWQKPATGASQMEQNVYQYHLLSNGADQQTAASKKAKADLLKKLDDNAYAQERGYHSRVRCNGGICEAAVILPPSRSSQDDIPTISAELINKFQSIDNNIKGQYVIASGYNETVGLGLISYYKY